MSEVPAGGVAVHYVQADMLGKRTTQAIRMKQLDNRMRYLKVQLVNDEEAFSIPEGAHVRLRGLKPDGKGAYLDAVEFSGDTATFEINANFLAVNGKMPCEVEVSLGDDLVKSRTFFVEIEKEALPSGVVISSDEYPALLAASEAAKKSQLAAAQSEENAAASEEAAKKAAQEAGEAAREQVEELKGDLADKQDKLIPGTGIVIGDDGKTICAPDAKDTKARLLADIEITESVSVIRIDNDLDGKPLRLSKVYFAFEKIVSNNKNQNAYLEFLSYNGNYSNIASNSLIFANEFNTGNSVLVAELECLAETPDQKTLIRGVYYNIKQEAYMNRFYGGGIKSAQIRASGTNSIGIGTKLKIYGIDY